MVSAIHSSGLQGSSAAADLQRLRETTGKVVGSVFFGTLLKSMRESGLKGTFGHGGRGEEVFGAQLHQIWAEKTGEASHKGLADALYRHLAGQQERMSMPIRPKTSNGTESGGTPR